MNLATLVEKLQGLSKLKNNWFAVAVVVEEFKKGNAGKANLSRLIKEACETSGFNQNTINRMLAVKAFFDTVSGEVEALEGVDPNNLSFPSMEVVKRMHQVDPNEGFRMLTNVIRGDITFRDLRDRYNSLISENSSKASIRQMSRREFLVFEDAVLERIPLESAILFGTNLKIEFSRKYDRRYPFSIDSVAWSVNSCGGTIGYYGFEYFYCYDQKNFRRYIDMFLKRILLNSHFFDEVWVIFPSDIGIKKIEAFTQILYLLDCPSIGVSVLPWGEDEYKNNNLRIIKRPVALPAMKRARKIDVEAYGELIECLISVEKH